jgi:hypothetical protein
MDAQPEKKVEIQKNVKSIKEQEKTNCAKGLGYA